MSESYIQRLFADRIGGAGFGKDTAIYKFEKIKRAKRAAITAHPGVELLDLGVGEPDDKPCDAALSVLTTESRKLENRGYADNGGPVLKEAAVRFMKNVCNVDGLDPERHVVHSIGSKAALSILPACLINSGDVVLMTVPGYPVFGTHAKYYGGVVHNLPLTADRNFLPELESIPAEVLSRAKVLVLNYPNNPTGASATREFFVQVVEFARRNHLVVIHDFAYAALVYEGEPLSFLSTPGALEVGLELHSASKNFNMTGWRCGFVVGNELLIKAYANVKDNTDSGQYLAIQHAVAYCFDHPEITQEIATKYSRRMDLLVPVLQELGFRARKPGGSFFLYVPVPRQAQQEGRITEFPDAEAFSQWMITENLISTVPWDDAGAFVRFSVTFTAEGVDEEKRVVGEIGRRLGRFSYVF